MSPGYSSEEHWSQAGARVVCDLLDQLEKTNPSLRSSEAANDLSNWAAKTLSSRPGERKK